MNGCNNVCLTDNCRYCGKLRAIFSYPLDNFILSQMNSHGTQLKQVFHLIIRIPKCENESSRVNILAKNPYFPPPLDAIMLISSLFTGSEK